MTLLGIVSNRRPINTKEKDFSVALAEPNDKATDNDLLKMDCDDAEQSSGQDAGICEFQDLCKMESGHEIESEGVIKRCLSNKKLSSHASKVIFSDKTGLERDVSLFIFILLYRYVFLTLHS